MRFILVTILILMIVLLSCKKNNDNSNHSDFRDHIKFNHLYIVIDELTYNHLLDSLSFLETFSSNSEVTVNTENDSWTGKYLIGKSNYLEIFKSGGSDKLGDFGLAFMTNKFGTVDSLENYWTKTLDSVRASTRNKKINEEMLPWFKSVAIPRKDSLVKIFPWVMEHTKEEMFSVGFRESDLLNVIEYEEYVNRKRAIKLGNPVNSVKYDKLYDEAVSLKLSLSDKELDYLRTFLLSIGFTEKENSFLKDDFKITFSVSESEHFLLKEIGFTLLETLPKENHSFRHIEMNVDGNKATMKFNYQ